MSFSKEEEIRPRNVFKKMLECCEQDARTLKKIGQFEKIACPACGSSEKTSSFTKYEYNIDECLRCASLYVNPRPTKKCLDQFYPTSLSSRYFVEEFYPSVEEARKQKLIPERAERLIAFLQKRGLKRGVIADVGAGQGFFLDVLKERLPNFELRAIEPNPDFAKICREKGFGTTQAFVEENRKWQGELDIVTCFEVFEHVQNPALFIASLQRLLKPTGCLLITSLAGDGFDIQVLRDKAEIVAPPQHLNFLSVKGYKTLFHNIGFSSVEITTPGKLDVNIVENKETECPGTISGFEKTLLRRSDDVKKEFQAFLAKNCLSSHVWVFAVC